jgi:hypothetical protein
LNNGCKKTLTEEHDQHILKLIDEDPQIFVDDIVHSLTKNFEKNKKMNEKKNFFSSFHL